MGSRWNRALLTSQTKNKKSSSISRSQICQFVNPDANTWYCLYPVYKIWGLYIVNHEMAPNLKWVTWPRPRPFQGCFIILGLTCYDQATCSYRIVSYCFRLRTQHPRSRGRVGNLCCPRRSAGRKQMVRVIWHKAASPPQTDSSIIFANVPPPMRAHWRHLANTTELVLLSVHSSLQSKRQIDRFSRFAELTTVYRQTDRQTHHATRSVTVGHIYVRPCYVRSTAMLPNDYQ